MSINADSQLRDSVTRETLAAVLAVAERAGEEIMAIYNEPVRCSITEKMDASPLTAADLAAHQCIIQGLRALSNQALARLPVLSEESPEEALRHRHEWPAYWLVDPLDGTKEFIARNGEFSVNIALVIAHEAVLGVVYGPATGVAYVAAQGVGSFRFETAQLMSSPMSAHKSMAAWMPIQASAPDWRTPTGALVLTVSRRHGLERLAQFERSLQAAGWQLESRPAGSAFKICAVAEGRAHAYPRFGPTSEWDTAAAQVVLEQAGGELVDGQGRRFRYNCRETVLNGDFIAAAGRSESWLLHWPSVK